MEVLHDAPGVGEYLLFSSHCEDCTRCERVRLRIVRLDLRRVQPRDVIRRLFPGACEEGQQLLWEGDTAVQDYVQADDRGVAAKRLGIWDEWDGRDERVEALMDLPQREVQGIVAIEKPQARENEIEAIVRSRRRFKPEIVPVHAESEAGTCRSCGAKVKNPDHDLCWRCYQKER